MSLQSQGHFGFGRSLMLSSLNAVCALVIDCHPLCAEGHVADKVRPTELCELKGNITKYISGSCRMGQLLISVRVRKIAVMKVQLCGLWKCHLDPKFPLVLPLPECFTLKS